MTIVPRSHIHLYPEQMQVVHQKEELQRQKSQHFY